MRGMERVGGRREVGGWGGMGGAEGGLSSLCVFVYSMTLEWNVKC